MDRLVALLKKPAVVYWIIIVAGISYGSGIIYSRYQVEHSNKNVELIVSYSAIKKLSSTYGQPMDTLLTQLHVAGVRSIALEERTVDSLEQQGLLSLISGYNVINSKRISKNYSDLLSYLVRSVDIDPGSCYLIIDEADLYDDIRNQLVLELGQESVRELLWNILEIRSSEEYIRSLPLGFNRAEAGRLKDYDFQIIPRLRNSYRLDAERLGIKFNNLADTGLPIKTIIFEGDSILGYKNELAATIQKMKKYGFYFGLIEFAKQKGDERVARAIPDQVMRVHSISESELAGYTPRKAAQRFFRAVHERNIRLLFINPLYDHELGSDMVGVNLNYIGSIVKTLEKNGYKAGTATQYNFFNLKTVDMPGRVLVTVGLWCLAMLLLQTVVRISWQKQYIMLAAAALISIVGVLLFSGTPVDHILALVAAVLFPAYAIISQFPHTQYEAPYSLSMIMKKLIVIFIIALAGAFFVTILLTKPAYILGIKKFMGVKIAFLAPLILTGLFFFVEPHRFKSFLYVLRRTLVKPITNAYLAVSLTLAVILLFYITRSGNNFFIPVTGAETVFREFLEAMLYARPRTKEILLAYPVIVFSLYGINRLFTFRKLWLLAALATIAPISLINTFSHIHSPFIVSLYRSFVGLAVGVAVGVIATAAFLASRNIFLKLEKRK